MSSALRKKRKMKPLGYENRFAMQEVRKKRALSEDCFTEIFYSMQLINFTVLYAPLEENGFDFSKQKLKNFNKILIRHNQEYDNGGLISTLVENSHLKKFDFDCRLEAQNFPYRAKMKMYGKMKKTKSMKEHELALRSINAAIETYLILAIHTLHENYRFNRDMIWQWWKKLKEIAEYYVQGMNDEFIIQYFKDECDLSIDK